jgi:hypothetical protein
MRCKSGMMAAAGLGAVLLAACGPSKQERCKAVGDRYDHLFRERHQEATEIVPLERGNDQLTPLETTGSLIRTRVSHEFVGVCEELEVDELSRCVEVEVEHFARLEAEKRDLGLDLKRPWLLSPKEPACAAILGDLERRLGLRREPASGGP